MEINDLRKERNAYIEVNKKLQKELKSKKVELEKEIKEAEEIYLRKENIKKKLVDLKKDADK